MFDRSPPWNIPTVTTLGLTGSMVREGMVWKAMTTCAAMTMGSIPSWGAAPWVWTPFKVMRKLSTAAMHGPTVYPTSPTGMEESAWRPKTASGRGSR